ncbi:hypothetical protein FQA39_LY15711 [Lamprigera yunnana]|nr:hypothetical protein FQA39_LY15711 [Lamprigera yunnana]
MSADGFLQLRVPELATTTACLWKNNGTPGDCEDEPSCAPRVTSSEMSTAPKSLQPSVGGETAIDGQFPYQVSIHVKGRHSCGGSIIDSNTILTAARCLMGYYIGELTVVIGTNKNNEGSVTHSVAPIVYHSGFNFGVGQHDIGLL